MIPSFDKNRDIFVSFSMFRKRKMASIRQAQVLYMNNQISWYRLKMLFRSRHRTCCLCRKTTI